MKLRELFNFNFEKSKNGTNEYFFNNSQNFEFLESNIEVAQSHCILTPAILFISKLFSQAEFELKHIETDKAVKTHWLLRLLKNPNQYQTTVDFLETLMFVMIADGKAIVYLKRTAKLDPSSMYILRNDSIQYDSNFKTPIFGYNKNQNILYNDDGSEHKIKVSDLLFFYDLPNAMSENMFESRSRLDGLKQTLENTNQSLIAKNVILKTNGKELITSKSNDLFPLQDAEKEKIEQTFFKDYGLGYSRKRGLVTKSDITWQSMHIALRDLGLDESIKVDGNIIYTALHIPKDILSLEAKKTTYNNYKESMVSFVQNEIQGSLNAVTSVFNKLLMDDNIELSGNYNHLPVMQFILIEKYQGITNRALALKNLLMTGIPKEIALKLCDFDKNIDLGEIISENNNNNNNGQQRQEGQEEKLQIMQRVY